MIGRKGYFDMKTVCKGWGNLIRRKNKLSTLMSLPSPRECWTQMMGVKGVLGSIIALLTYLLKTPQDIGNILDIIFECIFLLTKSNQIITTQIAHIYCHFP